METFAAPKAFVVNPHFEAQRRKNLIRLSDVILDIPIIEIVHGLNRLPYCFTLQSCFGHFLYPGQNDPHNVDPLPDETSIGQVTYRIAYVAFCLEGSASGERFLSSLEEITYIEPETIQLCSPQWFWDRQVNSYALQVEPERFKHKDKAIFDFEEALNVEKVRNRFFAALKVLLKETR